MLSEGDDARRMRPTLAHQAKQRYLGGAGKALRARKIEKSVRRKGIGGVVQVKEGLNFGGRKGREGVIADGGELIEGLRDSLFTTTSLSNEQGSSEVRCYATDLAVQMAHSSTGTSQPVGGCWKELCVLGRRERFYRGKLRDPIRRCHELLIGMRANKSSDIAVITVDTVRKKLERTTSAIRSESCDFRQKGRVFDVRNVTLRI